MKLKEVTVDCFLGEAGYNINLAFESNHLCNLFIRLVGEKHFFKNVHKISIVLMDEKMKTFNGFVFERNVPLEMLNIIRYYIDFDLESYLRLDSYGRKKKIWDIIVEVAKSIFSKYHIQVDDIDKANEKAVNDNYKNIFSIDGIKLSKNKKYFGEIKCEFDIDRLEIYAIIYDNSMTIIKNEKIFDWAAGDGYYWIHLLKKSAWIDDLSFGLFFKPNNIFETNPLRVSVFPSAVGSFDPAFLAPTIRSVPQDTTDV